METSKESEYEVVFTHRAEVSYYEIMDYLFQNHPFDRAEKLAEELRERARSLATYPRRGSLEPTLSGRGLEHRFILYRRTKRADIKIIYFIEKKRVFVTDFFLTERDIKSLIE